MSLATDRTALVNAVDAVAGINCYSYSPPQLTQGDAWVRWTGHAEGPARGVFAANWIITVVAGQTLDDAMAFTDTKLATLEDAIYTLVWVTGAIPVDLGTESTPLYGVQITAQKES